MPQIKLGDLTLNYDVIRSPRSKGISIKISPMSGITVILPLKLVKYVNTDNLIREKEDWILKNVMRFELHLPKTEFQNGTNFYYLGNLTQTNVQFNDEIKGAKVLFKDQVLNIVIGRKIEHRIKEIVCLWLKQRAKNHIKRIVIFESNRMNISFNKITIRDQRTKWGSCTKDGKLNFNWRLVMMPEKVIHYLAIHELSHRVYFNHSKEYWELVNKFDADYKTSENWLKIEGLRIAALLI